MKNLKSIFLIAVLTNAIGLLSANLPLVNVYSEDTYPLKGKYLNDSPSQIANKIRNVYDGADLPKARRGRSANYISSKTRFYQVKLNSIRVDAVPQTGDKAPGQRQSKRGYNEGNDLEIMGIIAIAPKSNRNLYRGNEGANDVLFSRDLNGNVPIRVDLGEKFKLNKVKDYYINNDECLPAGFKLKFALQEYDKNQDWEDPFKADFFDVNIGNWGWDSGYKKTYQKQLKNELGDKVITVFFTVKLLPRVSDAQVIDAVCDRDMGRLEDLLRQGGNPNAKDAFFYAARDCNVDMLNLLADFGGVAKAKHLTKLLNGSSYKQEAVRLLIDFGAQPNSNHLQNAILNGHQDLAYYLLQNGAKPSEKNLITALDKNQRNIVFNLFQHNVPVSRETLQAAIHFGDIELVNLILARGVVPTSGMLTECVKDQNFGMTRCLLAKVKPDNAALCEAAIHNDTEMFGLLIQYGGFVTDNRVIHKAIDFENFDIVSMALANGGNVNDGLDYSMARNSRGMVQLFLDEGANPNLAFPYAINNNDDKLFGDLIRDPRSIADDALAAAVMAQKIKYAEMALKTGRANPNLHMEAAAIDGNENLVRMLVDHRGDPNLAMPTAVKSNNTNLVDYLIQKGARASNADFLRSAVAQDNIEMVALLVENGANPNKGMDIAVGKNRVRITEYLLSKGALVQDFIAIASANGHREMIYLLLDNGANPNHGMVAAIDNDRVETVEVLLNHGAHTQDHLAKPAGRGNAQLVKLLLVNDAPANEGMAIAVKNNQTEIVRILLDHGASSRGFLKPAVKQNNPAMVRLFLRNGEDPNEGMDLAIQNGYNAVVKELLNNGAFTSNANYMKTAVEDRNYKLIRLLANAKASTRFEYPNGQNFLHYATSKNNNLMTIMALVEAGVEMNKADFQGNTPLHFAVAKGKHNLEVVKYLVQSGAFVNATNDNGKSILRVAKSGKVKRVLRKNGAKRKGWN